MVARSRQLMFNTMAPERRHPRLIQNAIHKIIIRYRPLLGFAAPIIAAEILERRQQREC